LEVPALPSDDLLSQSLSENSATIKKRTTKARQIQQKRFKNNTPAPSYTPPISANTHMNHHQIKKHCSLTEEGKKLLKSAIESLGLSARSYDKILRVSRTIADLANEKNILPDHISEAVQYRNLDRDWWG